MNKNSNGGVLGGLLMVIGGLVLITFMVGGCVIGNINSLRTQDELCSTALSEIDNQLERKDKLIPNLVATVKGYAKHEDKVMSAIADSRKAMFNAKTPGEKLAANDGLNQAIGRLMMVTENYPQLKADKQFVMLQDQLEGTENRITVARMDYNRAANSLNVRIRTFPYALFVGIAGVEKRQYFEASEKAKTNSVTVEF